MTRHLFLAVAVALALVSAAAAQEPVMMETCEVCHDDVAPVFAAGTHGRAMAKVDNAILDRSCVGCHGDATEHIDDPTTDNIKRIPDAAACLSCHPGREAMTDVTTTAHVRSGVACLDCHRREQPGIFNDWAYSRHANANITCLDCHMAEVFDPDVSQSHYKQYERTDYKFGTTEYKIPVAAAVTACCTATKPSWFSTTAASDQPATRLAVPRPTPRKPPTRTQLTVAPLLGRGYRSRDRKPAGGSTSLSLGTCR